MADKKKEPATASWSVTESEALYRIDAWGAPYFGINAAGHITVSPHGDRGGSLDLWELVQSLRQRKVELPLLIRFPDILTDRLERLNSCFAEAIARYNYGNRYQGVYPLNCNQQQHLLSGLVRQGHRSQFGLAVGSLPELMIALAMLPQQINQSDKAYKPLIICRGYKDQNYLETALLASRLGLKTIIVIEQLQELGRILTLADQLVIKPRLGVQLALSSQDLLTTAKGTPAVSPRCGLSVPDLVKLVKRLQATKPRQDGDRLGCLRMLTFQLGTQISDIAMLKEALRETSRVYVELVQEGAKLQYFNVGDGLAVDYDGSKSNTPASKNYNMQNYANDIVAAVQDACQPSNVPEPILISESGRALMAHQSVLIFDVLGSNEKAPAAPIPPETAANSLLHDYWECYQSVSPQHYAEAYHDALQLKAEAISLFNFGYLTLEERAQAETLHWSCCEKICRILRQLDAVPEDFQNLERTMTSTYYANLSVFQSTPESWSLKQLFPIVPIHHLNQKPTHRAVLADLTCDSDGKIDRFISSSGVKADLAVHGLDKDNAPYYLGIFLVGAYQEIMGNLHNLFGDINVVHIGMTPNNYQIESIVRGDTMKEVLGYVQYSVTDLVETLRRYTEEALRHNQITLAESHRLLRDYEQSLRHYTYLAN